MDTEKFSSHMVMKLSQATIQHEQHIAEENTIKWTKVNALYSIKTPDTHEADDECCKSQNASQYDVPVPKHTGLQTHSTWIYS